MSRRSSATREAHPGVDRLDVCASEGILIRLFDSNLIRRDRIECDGDLHRRVPIIWLLIAPPLTRKVASPPLGSLWGLPLAQGPHPITAAEKTAQYEGKLGMPEK